MARKCDDPNCYNCDYYVPVFCNECLADVINEFTIDDIYEIFIEGNETFDTAIMDGEAHGIITSKGKKTIVKSKKKWFSIINKILREKLKNEL